MKEQYSNFDVLCALLVPLSVMAFVITAVIEKRIDYTLLIGIVFGVVMPHVIRKWFLK